MAINLHLPGKSEALRPTITVVGIGGAGGNAVNNMINASLEGVNFVVANTDAQALENSMTERRIQLGINITRGLGAGASPEVGRAAAEEAMDEIAGYIDGSNMVFITAGMGGGTGTGAAPVIARLAKERGILTVGVVTKPFQFEGAHRMRLAEQGLHDLQQYVDTLIVIPNQNLFRIANEKTTFADAFRMADEVLHSGVRGVTDLMIMPGLINLDFADIRTVMREMGKAMMGTGEAEGAKRAVEAAEAAISNPLLDDVSMKGAKGVLINITGGYDMTLYEADEAATRIREEVDPDANIIFGATFNPALEGKIRVSVVATGIDAAMAMESTPLSSNKDTNRFYAGKIGFGAKPAEPIKSAPATAKTPDFSQKDVRRTTFVPPASAIKDLKPATTDARMAVTKSPSPLMPEPVEVAQVALPLQENDEIQFTKEIRTSVGAASHAAEEIQAPLQAVNEQTGVAQAAVAQHRSPSFVTPPAAQPMQRNFFAQQNNTEFEQDRTAQSSSKISPRDQASSYGTSSNEAPVSNSMSFFQRMAGVGRVLTSKPEQAERSLQVIEKSKADVTEHVTKTSNEDDYLEIPAFLRRQAN